MQLVSATVPPEQTPRCRDRSVTALVVAALYVRDGLEVREIERAGGRFAGKCVPASRDGLQMGVGKGEIGRNGVKPADRLGVASRNTLFRETVVAQPRLNIGWPAINGEEVEEIVQMTDRLNQRRAQLAKADVDRQ